MLVCILFCANRTRDRGCSEHPVFPAPSHFEGEDFPANLGRIVPREYEAVFAVIASGAMVQFDIAAFYTFRDGRIAQIREIIDTFDMVEQVLERDVSGFLKGEPRDS